MTNEERSNQELDETSTSVSRAIESGVFDFDQYYGSDRSDVESVLSVRPDSGIRPYSCGIAISLHQGDQDALDDESPTKDAGSEADPWWRHSIISSDSNSVQSHLGGSSYLAEDVNPKAMTTFLSESRETSMPFVNESRTASLSRHDSPPLSSHVPEIRVDMCDDQESLPVQQHAPVYKYNVQQQSNTILPRSARVSFASNHSVIPSEALKRRSNSKSREDSEIITALQDQKYADISCDGTQSGSVSRQSMAVLPAWASVYYKRGSACLTQLARRSTLKWSSRYDSSEESISLVDTKVPDEELVAKSQISITFERRVTRPPAAHNTKSIRKSTFRCSSRISELSWKPDLKHAIEVPIKIQHENASLVTINDGFEDGRLLKKIICIFTLGFLFPPLWLWGCFLGTKGHSNHPIFSENTLSDSLRKVNHWKIACAVMLGIALLMIMICAIVALTMKDTK